MSRLSRKTQRAFDSPILGQRPAGRQGWRLIFGRKLEQGTTEGATRTRGADGVQRRIHEMSLDTRGDLDKTGRDETMRILDRGNMEAK